MLYMMAVEISLECMAYCVFNIKDESLRRFRNNTAPHAPYLLGSFSQSSVLTLCLLQHPPPLSLYHSHMNNSISFKIIPIYPHHMHNISGVYTVYRILGQAI